jgi:hypothetical protein
MSRENVEIMRTGTIYRGPDGAAIDARPGWVAHFREGLVTSFHTYADRSEALKAVLSRTAR